MNTIIIDIEFTGLDNTFIRDNEITQVKMMNVDTKQGGFSMFSCNKPVSVYDKVFGKVEQDMYNEGEPLFSKDAFTSMLIQIAGTGSLENIEFWGFSPQQDILMLKKYGIDIKITDMKDKMRLCSDYELLMAQGNSKMECCYYMLTGKIPPTDTHYDARELNLLLEMYEKIKDLKLNNYLTVMPFTHCAGMPIEDYIINYRRQADGYRYNNTDILAASLTHAINEHDSVMDDDDLYEDPTEEDDLPF